MSSDDLADFWVHRVSVRTYLGKTGGGVISYADPVTVDCRLSRKLRLVRDLNAEQVASAASLSADITWADTLTARSEVTELAYLDGAWIDIANATPTTIITASVSTGGQLITGLDHVKAFLQ